jgi:hypothetical protein
MPYDTICDGRSFSVRPRPVNGGAVVRRITPICTD